ncbi:HEPN family nuclease [Marmoricola sp. URHB0036]|uniref:HEPN family nuclease n=1 Tax=Marmoricola sp. URHB0036 TaxID=1298863 RepID=UPI000484967D|nr:HEPN family nuclease [Marmoricola sp. URHB0036]
MEYKHLIRDFASRTLENLDHIQAQEALGNHDVHPVTQLWNSLLGLVVAPREREVGLIPRTPMPKMRAQGWPKLSTLEGSEPEDLRDFLRYLRNAVAHFNVEFGADDGGEIEWVEIWNRKGASGPVTWKARISVEDLEQLARRIAAMYLGGFATSAA